MLRSWYKKCAMIKLQTQDTHLYQILPPPLFSGILKPYSWCIESPTYGFFSKPLPMEYQVSSCLILWVMYNCYGILTPFLLYIDPSPTHGILTPYPWNIKQSLVLICYSNTTVVEYWPLPWNIKLPLVLTC